MTLSVPGRVNLIGEHIDYHGLPVLPIAIDRRITITFTPRPDVLVRAASAPSLETREFTLSQNIQPSTPGDWINYLKAAARAASLCGPLTHGIDAQITSDLPSAAGLSSSTALLVAVTLALLRANDLHPTLDQLMHILPDAEQFVGTRGGGMDHAAVLASRAGRALLINFTPFFATPIPIPPDWAFLIAHSLTTAEKSTSARQAFNSRRADGERALNHRGPFNKLPSAERRAFRHTVSEARRVHAAVDCLRAHNPIRFGQLLSESHASLRDDLRVSTPSLDRLVQSALDAGALGARLTGAGFGGCAIIFCLAENRDSLRAALTATFYKHEPAFDPQLHLIDALPSNGALYA